ncbi:hypothetical protein GMMP15_20003 [Candidatus Magnetomoraceae bacterium gMMP-15]
MEKIFKDAKDIRISKEINIDTLMNEMNDAEYSKGNLHNVLSKRNTGKVC